MKPQPKRTTTHQGIGKVSADDASVSAAVTTDSAPPDPELRRSSKRERFSSAPPTSAPEGIPSSRPVKSSPPIGREDPDEVVARPAREEAPLRGRATKQPATERTAFYREGFGRRDPAADPAKPSAPSAPPKNKPNKPVSAPPKGAGRGRSMPPPRGRSLPPPRHVPDTQPPKSAPVTDTKRRTLSNREPVAVDHVGKAGGASAVGVAGRAVPKIVRSKDEIAAAPIDHRAGFLLAHIDGVTTVQGLIDIAGMGEEDVHAILERLRRLGIVQIR